MRAPARMGRHQLVGLLRQSVFGRLAGYEDVNDADLLCRDPAMRWVVGDRAIDGTAASASQMAAPRRSGPLPTTAPESGKCRLTQAAQFPAPRGRASHHFWLSTDQLRSNLLWSGLDHGLNARFPTRPSTDTSYDVNMTQTDPGNVSAGNTIRIGLVTCAIVLSMTFLFLLPALYNGFPLVYTDTGGYLSGLHIPFRSVYYNIFNWIFDRRVSPWPSVVLQSLTVSYTISQFASALFDITDFPRMFLLAVFLILGTSLPWFVSWIMPDIFTALMIIALVLLCFAQDTLLRPSKIFLVMLVGVALAFHQANLPVALWILPALRFVRPSGLASVKALSPRLFRKRYRPYTGRGRDAHNEPCVWSGRIVEKRFRLLACTNAGRWNRVELP
jgi:hypothetical protein